jgi:8-oxo-dGTP pyrophosphatase MutT (NUDIX family)
MTVVYAGEDFPTTVRKTLFLAGPTPRDPDVASWRPEALRLLKELGYDGHVFVPENRNKGPYDFLGQVGWEYEALNRADVIVFWVPRDMKDMPALTTNIEWGLWCDSGKAVFGAPDNAPNMRYMKWQCDKLKVPMFNDLSQLLGHVVKDLGEGWLRDGGGESKVPIHIWSHPTFQGWYAAQKSAGNWLDDLRVLWSFRVGPKRDKVFSWAVHVSVWVAAEGRHKSNEFVLGRLDIACMVLYAKGRDVDGFDDNIVLVREFRSPSRTTDGYITELPGGGVSPNDLTPAVTALKELQEETGFSLDPNRLRKVGARQLSGTLSAHEASVFSAEITQEELSYFKSQVGQVRGVVEDGERTSILVTSLSRILKGDYDIDWSTVGMIASAVL